MFALPFRRANNDQDFWTLAPDECPDPELDLPFACHDGGMSDAKKDKKNLNFLVWEKYANAHSYISKHGVGKVCKWS